MDLFNLKLIVLILNYIKFYLEKLQLKNKNNNKKQNLKFNQLKNLKKNN